MDLIHPDSPAAVAAALRAATQAGRRVRIVGGRTHADRGAPRAVDMELWTTQLDGTVAYEPAEMIAVVEAGMRVRTLQARLRDAGQEWPVDAPADATVGGVVAAGVSSIRRLRVGQVRDTVVELDLVTGDGRAVRSGARTVKNVTGFDIHRLATGSFGCLGAIVRVGLKVRPLPHARRTLVFPGDGLRLGGELLAAVPSAAAILAERDRVELRLEGWAAEVDELTDVAAAVGGAASALEDDAERIRPVDARRREDTFPTRPVDDAPFVVEAAVPPSRIPAIVDGFDDWTASIGVGSIWFRLAEADVAAIAAIAERSIAAGGWARPVRGTLPEGALAPPPVAAAEVQRRLRAAFDPGRILS